ncbi:acetoacetate--CoA ligase [Nocardia gipuzkoensis]|uniref:acetoacetate--CoA ligase n=1 Tax=Nocardia gipuzkoensis TaxID=2749991 RepID=UPI003EE3F114
METDSTTRADGAVLRWPDKDVVTSSGIGEFAAWLAEHRGLDFADHETLWRWSVDDIEGFWEAVWRYFGVRAHRPYDRVLGSRDMPGAKWFPGALLNYAEHMIGEDTDVDLPAVLAYSQTRDHTTLTFGELREQVACARTGLRRLGVRAGDRIVGYVPNVPETLIVFLAAASLGAVWASCAPEFGARAVIDRFAQLEPTILLMVTGYRYGAKTIDRSSEVAAIRSGLPTLRHVIQVPYGQKNLPGVTSWDEFIAEPGTLEFDPVPFDHPLYVLFSSGTTGLPKAIVHCHGGILLEHLKIHAFTLDIRRGDRALWFTTTAWTMWNFLISALLRRAAVVMVDGDFQWPDVRAQWHLAAESKATLMGTSPGYVMASRDCGVRPTREFDLSRLRQLGVTGAPLPETGFDWLDEQFEESVAINVMSGGTDTCTAFVAGGPWLPTYRGELAGRCLGVDAAAYDLEGNEVVDELGELVIRKPMPSMPVQFWNDPNGSRYRESYFGTYPGIWRHGDWVLFRRRGSCVITGRSDATLNRGGVRLGTNEFYQVVEELDEVRESLVLHIEDPAGGSGKLMLFVVLQPDRILDEKVRTAIHTTLRSQLSPRHVPDSIIAVTDIPRTATGKKLETPIKQILLGRAVDDVVRRDAIANPNALDAFIAVAPLVSANPAKEK